MLESKIDIKTILILVLAAALVFGYIFRPSKPIDMYEDEINSLKEQNKELLQNNDSLNVENYRLDKEVESYLIVIDSTQVLLDKNKDKITELEDGKSKISSYVNTLNVNDVTGSLTDYLNRRKGHIVR